MIIVKEVMLNSQVFRVEEINLDGIKSMCVCIVKKKDILPILNPALNHQFLWDLFTANARLRETCISLTVNHQTVNNKTARKVRIIHIIQIQCQNARRENISSNVSINIVLLKPIHMVRQRLRQELFFAASNKLYGNKWICSRGHLYQWLLRKTETSMVRTFWRCHCRIMWMDLFGLESVSLHRKSGMYR